MHKNPEAMKQYLADRTARAGAELRELTGTDTVLLPVTGEPKLYVAVGTLAGIAHTAQRSLGEAAGNTNKAVLTDEQINELLNEQHSYNPFLTGTWPVSFARAIEAAVLYHASKADVCAQMRALCSACGGTGDVVSIDGEWRGTCDCEASRAAPAPADNPSTAGAGNERALFESWAQGRVTSLIQGKFGTGYVYADAARAWDAWKARASLAAPALNPSDVQWAQWIVHRGPGLPDYACADCVPNSHMLKPGFQCVYHEAAAVLKGAPAQSVEGGEA